MELWRAALAQAGTLENQMKSEAVFACYRMSQEISPTKNVHQTLSEISRQYTNSMVVEFAKRATVVASQTSAPGTNWPGLFFKEIAGYLVSRDASGYLGGNCRSKTVGELMSLKRAIGSNVTQKVSRIHFSGKSSQEWSNAVDVALGVLAGKR